MNEQQSDCTLQKRCFEVNDQSGFSNTLK